MSDVTITPADLRIGMYIHLDLGWMAHPFPLGSFKIGTQDQIETIRGLGLTQLRWVPEKSDPPFAFDAPMAEAAGPETGDFAPPPPVASAAEAVAAPAETPEAAERRQRREALAAQRKGLQHCERLFSESASALRQAMDAVPNAPAQARAEAETLARALVDRMPVDRDVSIRLLSEASGDKASAHALNVAIVSLLMGRVFGLNDEDMLDMGVGALMHDIGKLQLPDRVRFRDEHFTPAEVQYYQSHVAHGVSAGRSMGLRPGALLIIGQHHEHADGTGFPLHLNSDRMTLAARIVALVNRYDNLCNPHVPSKALTPHEAVSLMFASGKNKFDTAIMSAFIKMMGVYPPGSAVQLTDDRFALVMAVNSSRPLKPRVVVHDAKVPRDEALILDLEHTPTLGIRRSIKPQALPRDALEYLSPRQRVVYFFEPAHELHACEAMA